MENDKYKYNVNIYDVNTGCFKPHYTYFRMYLLNIYEKIIIYIYQNPAYVFSKYIYLTFFIKRIYGINIFHKYSYLTNSISSKCLINIGDCYGC